MDIAGNAAGEGVRRAVEADAEVSGGRRVRLRFADGALERDFRAEYARRFLGQHRTAFLLGAVLFGLFGFFDPLIIPEVTRFSWTLRYGVLCPLFLLALGSSYLPGVRRRIELVWPPLGVISGTANIALGLAQHLFGDSSQYLRVGIYYDYVGIMLVCAATFTFARVRFATATAVAWSVCLLYVAASRWTGSPVATLVTNLFFLVTLNFLGMFACYWMERSARQDFLQKRLIRRQADDLREALAEVKVLTGLLPICAWCKKVRDDSGYWNSIEEYLSKHTDASLTHGICPDCRAAVLGEAGGH